MTNGRAGAMRFSLALTLRTVAGAPLTVTIGLEQGPALQARLARPTIDMEGLGKIAGLTIGAGKVFQGGATGLNGSSQDSLDGIRQTLITLT